MAVWTETLANDITLPHIDVYRRYRDEVFSGYRVVTQEGYVMYDTTTNYTEPDPVTGENIPVTYYYTLMYCPVRTNFNTFTWIAVPRNSVPEDYIFGSENNNYKIM